jgi:hypothetical protein
MPLHYISYLLFYPLNVPTSAFYFLPHLHPFLFFLCMFFHPVFCPVFHPSFPSFCASISLTFFLQT